MGVSIFSMGLLLGLDTLVSQAHGAGRPDECHRWLAHGVFLSLLLSIPTAILVLMLSSALARWGLHPAVLALAQPGQFEVLDNNKGLIRHDGCAAKIYLRERAEARVRGFWTFL